MPVLVLGPDDHRELQGLVVDLQLGFGRWCLSGTVVLLGLGAQHNLYTPPVNLLTVAVGARLSRRRRRVGVRDARPARAGARAVEDAGALVAAPSLPALARIDELHRRRDDRAAFAEEQRWSQAALARAPERLRRRSGARPGSISGPATIPGLPQRPALALGQGRLGPRRARDRRQPERRRRLLLGGRLHGQLRAGPRRGEGAVARAWRGSSAIGWGAPALNDGYEHGGVETAWGRFFDKLPWPKRDRKQAEEHLRARHGDEPAALRARVYLASVYLDDDRAPRPSACWTRCAAAPVGRYDPPEERRAKAMAAGLQPELAAKLK